MTRVLSFDLDDTLWPVAPVIEAAERTLLAWIREHHPRAAADHDVESMRALRAAVGARFPHQAHDMTFLRRRALAEQFAAAGHDEAAAAAAFEVFFAARNRVRCYADVRPALARLSRARPLFALSNGNADLGLCGIAGFFSGHLSARSVGAAKPDPRMFAALAASAGVPAADILHIGDDPLADVEGARRAGMQAVWLNRDARAWPPELAPPPRTVASLEEID
ncbi:MAG: HAD-IA family hydrolase [Gammaproteobacteria bacterium]|nr:HAD-IA family hydrolase [Gammaproteobacteria bacterium]